MKIARYYDDTKNPFLAFFPGVPLRDLTEDEWDALDKRMQESIDLVPFYRKTKPTAAPAEKAAPNDAPDDVAARRAIIFKE